MCVCVCVPVCVPVCLCVEVVVVWNWKETEEGTVWPCRCHSLSYSQPSRSQFIEQSTTAKMSNAMMVLHCESFPGLL